MTASAVLAVSVGRQIVPLPRLDGAADRELGADRAREVDVEAGQMAVGVEEVERREIVGGDEADRLHRAGRRTLDAVLRDPRSSGSPAPHLPVRSIGLAVSDDAGMDSQIDTISN